MSGPRLLHQQSQAGYTRNRFEAMQDEPEAVSERAQEEISQRARQTEELRLHQVWVLQRERITRALSVLRDVGLKDPSLWFIERRVAKLDRRFGVK